MSRTITVVTSQTPCARPPSACVRREACALEVGRGADPDEFRADPERATAPHECGARSARLRGTPQPQGVMGTQRANPTGHAGSLGFPPAAVGARRTTTPLGRRDPGSIGALRRLVIPRTRCDSRTPIRSRSRRRHNLQLPS